MPSRQPAVDTKQFYDEGWNARSLGKQYDARASEDWRDGWKDCDSAPLSDRKEI